MRKRGKPHGIRFTFGAAALRSFIGVEQLGAGGEDAGGMKDDALLGFGVKKLQ